MSRLHAIELHLLMLAGIAFLCVSGWQVWRAGKTIDAVNGEIASLSVTQSKLDGDLTAARRLILEAGLTAMEARKASKLELTYLPQWNRQIGETMGNANQTITAMQGTANAATETLHGASLDLETMNDSIRATKPLIEASTATVRTANALISTPDVQRTTANLAKVTANVQRMTADGARITKDAADEADKLAHPPKKKLGFWGGFWVGMQYVHKMMPSIF